MLNIIGAQRLHTHTRARPESAERRASWVNCLLPSETSEQRRSEAI